MKFVSAEEKIDWKEQYDLICIGSGLGGLSAAVTAADLGLRAVVIEKADKVGGTTSCRRGSSG